MEKSEMMKRYEAETGKRFSHMQKRAVEGDVNCTMSTGYVGWLEAKANISDGAIKAFQKLIRTQCDEITALKEKAEAYDRIMSGGKKSMKEFANILGRAVVVDASGDVESFAGEPSIDLHYGFWYLNEDDEDYEDDRFLIPRDIVDFNGDWKDSLTLPDGWEETKDDKRA